MVGAGAALAASYWWGWYVASGIYLANVTDWTAEHGSSQYPTASFRRAQLADRHRCSCHTQLCTRAATQEDLLCDQCRDHPDCYAVG
jgi:hypothetical protein